MSTQPQVYASTGLNEAWEPFDAGEVRWLRRDEGPGRTLQAGIWRVNPEDVPERSPIEFPYDETLYMIEGEVRVEIEGGSTLELKRGDFASFNKGTKVRWTVLAPSLEFFVYS